MNKSKKVAYYGIFVSLAILFGYVETVVSIPMLVPGAKIGFANIVVVLTLYIMNEKSAAFVSIIRILISGILFASISAILYSLAGAFLSLLMMIILKKTNKFSIVGVSIVGGIFHNIGQFIIASVVMSTNLIIYFPALMFFGTITGFLIGIISKYTLSYLQRK